MKKAVAFVVVLIVTFLFMIFVVILVKVVTSKDKTTELVLSELPESYYSGLEIDNNIGAVNLRSGRNDLSIDRFPYVAAVIRNQSTVWYCGCFGSVILIEWVVTSAHCRLPGTTHRVLLYNDYIRNQTHTHPVLLWRLHEKYNISDKTPKYDIAVAKINVDSKPISSIKRVLFDEGSAFGEVADAAIWKTVSTMDNRLYLTDDFERYEVIITTFKKCAEYFDIDLDNSMICVDLSAFEDCFVNEFGPIYLGDKLVGILALKPTECKVKLAVFTNISYYTNWILKSTHTTYYG